MFIIIGKTSKNGWNGSFNILAALARSIERRVHVKKQ